MHRLDRFIQGLAKRPLWTAGWAAFLVILPFVTDFFLHGPEHLAEMDSQYAALTEKISDGDQILRIYDSLNATWSSVGEAATFYKHNLETRSTAERIPADVLATGLTHATGARRHIASSLGTVQGSTLHNAHLSAQLRGLQADLENADSTMREFEQFFSTYARGETDNAVRRLQQLDSSDALGAERESSLLLTRSNNWIASARDYQNESAAEIEKLLASKRSFTLRLYASLAGFAYAIAFLAIALLTWWRQRT